MALGTLVVDVPQTVHEERDQTTACDTPVNVGGDQGCEKLGMRKANMCLSSLQQLVCL